MIPTFLSIDWAFFIYNGEYDTITLPSGETIPGRMLYDFDRSESASRTMHDMLWQRRLGLFDAAGLNLRDEYAIRTDRKCIHPADFVRELSHRWPHVLDTPTWYADSNRHAGTLLKELAESHGPVRLVSFDSNHDLGYGFRGWKERVRRFSGPYGWWEADDWLLMSLSENLVSEVLIVYPDWRGFNEWNAGVQNRDYLHRFRSQIEVVTYSQYMQTPDDNSEIIAAFLARSAGWTPPYLDGDFMQLVRCFHVEACIDCTREGRHGVYKYDNGCQSRPFAYQELLEEEQDRTKVVNAIQRAYVLYAAGEVERAEEIIRICTEAGWDAWLDLKPKYQDSFLTPQDALNKRLAEDRIRQTERSWWSGAPRDRDWNLG